MDPATSPTASVAVLHAELKERLEQRARLLMDEVRRYPGPIARCDEQLSALLEQRASVFQALERLERVGPPDEDAASLAVLEECARLGALAEEDAELVTRLCALRDEWRAHRAGCGPIDAWTNDGGSRCAS